MAKSNPDPKRAAELSRQITALHDQLGTQARSYKLAPQNGNYGYTHMGSYGWCW